MSVRNRIKPECEKEDFVTAKVGDRIVIESERAAQTGRAGTIQEILSEEPRRLRVRWDDGRESIFVPSSGSARIETVKPKRKRAKAGKA
jgi:hypothetical protein